MVEQNNKLLLKHHQSHSTSFVPSPKANATTLHRHRWGPGKACNHGQRCDLEQDRNNLWDHGGHNQQDRNNLWDHGGHN